MMKFIWGLLIGACLGAIIYHNIDRIKEATRKQITCSFASSGDIHILDCEGR